MTKTEEHHISTDSVFGRRRAVREAPPRTHCLTLEHAGGITIGALLDYTPDGFGIETYEPLEVGQQVTLTGSVEIGGEWKKIHGKGHIVRCETRDEACYRLGISGADFGWRNTIDPNSPIFQRPSRYSSG